uniref:MATH domain and coiled-coil domain-containing protein n=1 Tax=Noccaea caerulescens TaxID=107243 RepID=A0A1J3FIH1_NOCCA
MEKQTDKKKITWVIKNFASLPSKKIHSDEFVAGGCRWRLEAFPKGNDYYSNHFSLELAAADSQILPLGWKRRTKVSLTVVNQFSDKLSQVKELEKCFNPCGTSWGFYDMISLAKLNAGEGFMVNGEVIVAVKLDVLEVEGKLDVPEESSPVMETVDVNGFQVLPSQVESVKRLFERHVDIATNFRSKNPILKTSYMNVLLSLTQTLCQISKDDLADKYAVLAYLKDSGFELGWLENKLDEIKEKKENEEACLARLQEMEEQLKPLKRKYTDMEAQIDKVKADLLAARAPDVSLYDDNVV